MPLTGGEVRFGREHDGRVAALTLSRPGKLNAITWEMRHRMLEHFQKIDHDGEIQLVVIRGEGDAFSPGGDIPGFMEVEPRDFLDLGHNLTAPARSPKPVLVAIDGYCFGAGLELAMACDIRVATRRSEFGQPEIRLGMIPGSGGSQRLVRYLGRSRAKYYIMTGERFSAEQAHDWGLVASLAQDADALEAEVERIVRTLLGYSPLALRLAKEVIDAGADGPLQTGIELERKAYSLLRASHDFAEGVDAYLNKRKPAFTGS
ncbi:MAG: enoyl-CoA hydratase/isomerase family protein [Solirubrobacterales bacterium]|nr:enoyl-CoA hydratase/isomerase family protein [Solirubrobacterales bacterium]MBV9425941.1 enoyl-CoA hydratase/isomerase family protein [Solirubrobacterales bacterium]MBV9798244.1 enoyl-CoA hydratase/isomerase family protein [Solirubrobacterales bacterium]